MSGCFCLGDLFTLRHISVLLSFLGLSDTPLGIYTTISLYIQPPTGIWGASSFWLLWMVLFSGVCVCVCMHVYTPIFIHVNISLVMFLFGHLMLILF